MNEICLVYTTTERLNARPNNNQLITYYLLVCYFLRIQQYPVNTTYNTGLDVES